MRADEGLDRASLGRVAGVEEVLAGLAELVLHEHRPELVAERRVSEFAAENVGGHAVGDGDRGLPRGSVPGRGVAQEGLAVLVVQRH